MLTRTQIDDITYRVIGAAIDVHKSLGPGLLESVYQKCLTYELFRRGIAFTSQHLVPVVYKEISMDTELRCDFFIEQLVAVEIKSVDSIAPIHQAQLLTYMKLLKAPKGILLNFNSVHLFRDGQKTLVNEWYAQLPG
jgi:GxxExxY protein